MGFSSLLCSFLPEGNIGYKVSFGSRLKSNFLQGKDLEKAHAISSFLKGYSFTSNQDRTVETSTGTIIQSVVY